MTEQEFNNQIAAKQQEIEICQKYIEQWNEQIELLKQAKKKMENLGDTLCQTADAAYNKVNDPSFMISAGFFSDVLEAIKGSEYQSAQSGIADAILEIQGKINEFNKKIEEKTLLIDQCSACIVMLQTEKVNFLEAEAQKTGNGWEG